MEQVLVFVVLGAALLLFLWGHWRYDVVALMALLALAVPGVVEPGEVFVGFGHPAVVTVAAVLVISHALERAGLVASIARRLRALQDRPGLQLPVLVVVIALASGFMNNVGALALLMPVAIRVSREDGRSPSRLLMPLAFGSLLGGLLTLIGTPPNIIISQFRAEAGDGPFAMFDFLPVGAGVALAGVVVVVLLGPRMVPERRGVSGTEGLFDIGDYLVELVVPSDAPLVGRRLGTMARELDESVVVVGLVRDGERLVVPLPFEVARAGDRLVVEADEETLDKLLDTFGLRLAPPSSTDGDTDRGVAGGVDGGGGPDEGGDTGEGDTRDDGDGDGDGGEAGRVDPGPLQLVEAVVAPRAPVAGRSASGMHLAGRHGVTLVAVSRRGESLRERPSRVRLETGDVLLLQGDQAAVGEALERLGLLPLADRSVSLGSPRRLALAGGLFAAALALTAAGLLAVEVALTAAAVAMVLVGLVDLDDAYRTIDWPVIVLIAAMLPVGDALQTTGGVGTITGVLQSLAGELSVAALLAAVLLVAMALSNVVNNAAAAVVVAPVAVQLADGVGASVDPFLMAVAVGTSLPLLTPIGHQSNTLVMGPGGYRFGDYWRLGLPVSVVCVVVAVPLLLLVWPPG